MSSYATFPFHAHVWKTVKHIPTWFPGAAFKRRAIMKNKLAKRMREAPYQMVQKRMVCISMRRGACYLWLIAHIVGCRNCCSLRCQRTYRGAIHCGRTVRCRNHQELRWRCVQWCVATLVAQILSHNPFSFLAGADTVSFAIVRIPCSNIDIERIRPPRRSRTSSWQ